jgi:hypothetical protein
MGRLFDRCCHYDLIITDARLGTQGWPGGLARDQSSRSWLASNCADPLNHEQNLPASFLSAVTASSSLRAADDCAAYQEALRALGDGAVRDFRIVEGLDYKHARTLRRVSSTGEVRT